VIKTVGDLKWALCRIDDHDRWGREARVKREAARYQSPEYHRAATDFDKAVRAYNEEVEELRNPAANPHVDGLRRFLYSRGFTLDRAAVASVREALWYHHRLDPDTIDALPLDRAVELLMPVTAEQAAPAADAPRSGGGTMPFSRNRLLDDCELSAKVIKYAGRLRELVEGKDEWPDESRVLMQTVVGRFEELNHSRFLRRNCTFSPLDETEFKEDCPALVEPLEVFDGAIDRIAKALWSEISRQKVDDWDPIDKLAEATAALNMALEGKPAATPKRVRPPELEARDAFLYEQLVIGNGNEKKVREQANKTPGWPRLSDRRHTWKMVDTYIEFHGLPQRKARKKGRPSKMSTDPGNVNRPTG